MKTILNVSVYVDGRLMVESFSSLDQYIHGWYSYDTC